MEEFSSGGGVWVPRESVARYPESHPITYLVRAIAFRLKRMCSGKKDIQKGRRYYLQRKIQALAGAAPSPLRRKEKKKVLLHVDGRNGPISRCGFAFPKSQSALEVLW